MDYIWFSFSLNLSQYISSWRENFRIFSNFLTFWVLWTSVNFFKLRSCLLNHSYPYTHFEELNIPQGLFKRGISPSSHFLAPDTQSPPLTAPLCVSAVTVLGPFQENPTTGWFFSKALPLFPLLTFLWTHISQTLDILDGPLNFYLLPPLSITLSFYCFSIFW